MTRRRVAVCLAIPLVFVLARVANSNSPWSLGSPPRGDTLIANLYRHVDFAGFDDPRMTLGEALDKLAKDYDLSFDVNEAAFKYDNAEDILHKEIATPTPIPPMKDVPVEKILRAVLKRIAINSGATLLLRRDHIEITTGLLLALEVGIPDVPGMQYPIVHLTGTQRTLEEWLEVLSEQSGQNIYLDPIVGQRGQAMVGSRMYNVPLDVAVHLLASGAGLTTVEVSNVLCVSTRENAPRLLSSPFPRLSRSATARNLISSTVDDGEPSPLSLLPKP
jgi:hypothetical protein